MIWASWLIVALMIGTHAFFWRDRRKHKRRRSEDFKFSGIALLENKALWVPFTATLLHVSPGHLANNLLMLMGVLFELEELMSGVWLLVLFCATGAVGWATTLFLARFFLYDADSWQAVKWQTSVGASPAIYGLCFLAAVAVRRTPVGAAYFGISHPIALVALMWFVPEILGLHTYTLKGGLLLSLIATIFLATIHFNYFASGNELTSVVWLTLYLTKTVFISAQQRFSGHQNLEDDSSHLGGCLFGLCVGLLFLPSYPPFSWASYLMLSIDFLYVGMRALRPHLF